MLTQKQPACVRLGRDRTAWASGAVPDVIQMTTTVSVVWGYGYTTDDASLFWAAAVGVVVVWLAGRSFAFGCSNVANVDMTKQPDALCKLA